MSCGVQGLTRHLWLALKTCCSMLFELKVVTNASVVVSAIAWRGKCNSTWRASIFPNTLFGTATFVESKLKRRTLSSVTNTYTIPKRLNLSIMLSISLKFNKIYLQFVEFLSCIMNMFLIWNEMSIAILTTSSAFRLYSKDTTAWRQAKESIRY